ncbi:MAG: type IV toxin-antitoxin system AbiEi family antitoxin [Prevotella sp.]|nr:type IV toxin-antitoxin system AbiEi family antitoxin [Prevotella sp.]
MNKNGIFALIHIYSMEQYSKVRYWIDALPKKGRIVFSQQEVEKQFPHLSLAAIRKSLYRLVANGKIQSVWHGFFVIVPVEYGLKGIVPPIEYIDQLMKHLGKEYYMALLSAAALQGASHQQPQEFTIITNSGNLRGKVKKDVKINFVTKKNIPYQLVTQMMTNNGYINVSTPELTAFDLIIYAKNVGGLNRAATVLNELAETLNFDHIDVHSMRLFDAAIIQRLGYLLETLGHDGLASVIERKSREAAIKFNRYPLRVAPQKNLSDFEMDKKWKLIINEEIDESIN